MGYRIITTSVINTKCVDVVARKPGFALQNPDNEILEVGEFEFQIQMFLHHLYFYQHSTLKKEGQSRIKIKA